MKGGGILIDCQPSKTKPARLYVGGKFVLASSLEEVSAAMRNLISPSDVILASSNAESGS